MEFYTMTKDHMEVREDLFREVTIGVTSFKKKKRHSDPVDLVFARNLLPRRRHSSLSRMFCRRSRSAWRIYALMVARARGWLIGGSVKLTVQRVEIEREPQDEGSETEENGEFGGHRDSFDLFLLHEWDRHDDRRNHLDIVRSRIYYAERVNKACGFLRVDWE